MLSGVNSLVSGLNGLVVAEIDIEDDFVFVVDVVLVVVFIFAALCSSKIRLFFIKFLRFEKMQIQKKICDDCTI